MRHVTLLVEDNADIRTLVRVTLEIGNFELHEVENGTEALACIHTLQPSLVLLDVMMPGEPDGLTLCRQIKQDPQLASTTVVLLSALARYADMDRGRQAGCDAYITKPFSPMRLIETLESMLARQQHHAGALCHGAAAGADTGTSRFPALGIEADRTLAAIANAV